MAPGTVGTVSAMAAMSVMEPGMLEVRVQQTRRVGGVRSFLRWERMISEFGGKLRGIDRLRNSWVVDGPRTTSDGEALRYFAAASTPRPYALVDFWAMGYVAPSWTFVVERYDEMLFMTEPRT